MAPVSAVSGALVNVAAIRGHEAYLYADPEETLWAQSYSRITNYACAEVDGTPSGAPSSGNWSENTMTFEYQRSGDLVKDTFLLATLSALPLPVVSTAQITTVNLWTPGVGWAFAKNVQLQIGSQTFDQFDSAYMCAYDEIHRAEGKRAGMSVGDYGSLLRGAQKTYIVSPAAISAPQDEDAFAKGITFSTRVQNICVPLPLHYCQHAGNTLNLIGMQQHHVVLQIDFRGRDDLIISGEINRATGAFTPTGTVPASSAGGVISNVLIRNVYTYLDTPERKTRAMQPETRLAFLQQIQVKSIDASASGTDVVVQNYFNHPIIDFIFLYRSTAATATVGNKQYFLFGSYRGAKVLSDATAAQVYYYPQENVSAISNYKLEINNYVRFSASHEYLQTSVPRAFSARVPTRCMAQYSIANAPSQEWCVTGSMNLSAIDNVVFTFSFKAATTSGGSIAANNEAITNVLYSNGAATLAVANDGSLIGNLFIIARHMNFYKQSGGLVGIIFAN